MVITVGGGEFRVEIVGFNDDACRVSRPRDDEGIKVSADHRIIMANIAG